MESELDDLLRAHDELVDEDDPIESSTLPPVASHDEEFPEQPPPVPRHAELPSRKDVTPALPRRPPAQPQPSNTIKRKPVGTDGTNGTHVKPELTDHARQEPPLSYPQQATTTTTTTTNESGWWSRERIHQAPQLNIRTDNEGAPPLPRRPVSIDSPTHVSDPAFARFDQARPYQKDFGVRPQSSYASIPRSPHSFDGTGVRRPSAVRPPMSPRSTTSSSLTRTSSRSSTNRANSTHESTLKGFNVTLIRRDPATGSQTNVGKITIPAVPSRYARPGKALIQLFNPGYEKFRAARGTSTADLVRCISEDDGCTYSCDLRLATRRRSVRSPSAPYFGDVPVNQLIAATPSQPYSFISPWNRVCEFSTGVSGRSLKCRHMLARGTLQDTDMSEMDVVSLSELRFNTPSSNLFAKASPKRNRRPHGHSASTGSVETVVPAVPPPLPPRKPLLSKIADARQSYESSSRSTLDNILDSGSAASSSFVMDDAASDDWDVEPMDLALGQERAGGGFRGNKAKLGKLIIEPEGLELLDLLIAANMGVWWSIR